eukprot:COSAG05_NODE_48_length_24425_cov_90.438543_21_plen_320_part_00
MPALQALLPLLPAASAALTVNQSGPSVDVWAAVDTLRKCGTIDVPDIPARAFVDNKGLTHMIIGSTGAHVMNGPSILTNGATTRECEYSWNQTADPNPANFAGDEFLDSPIAFENGTVVALVHTEYPGGVYNTTGPSAPMCAGTAPDGSGKAKNYPYCWTVTIGLAISHDFGATWAHARPPPHHLVAAVPYKYNQDHLVSAPVASNSHSAALAQLLLSHSLVACACQLHSCTGVRLGGPIQHHEAPEGRLLLRCHLEPEPSWAASTGDLHDAVSGLWRTVTPCSFGHACTDDSGSGAAVQDEQSGGSILMARVGWQELH